MAKKRSLQEDTAALKTKLKESSSKSENSEESLNVRTLRKRLKRAQRKIRIAKKLEADRTAKKTKASK